jgi:hypothetical protein
MPNTIPKTSDKAFIDIAYGIGFIFHVKTDLYELEIPTFREYFEL